MFDAHTAIRRERVWFMQPAGERQNTIVATVCGLIFSALVIGHLAGVL